MSKPAQTNKLKVRGITVAVLFAVIVLIELLTGNTPFVERYYSNGLYKGICFILHPILNIFPFSLGDVIYILVIGWLIYTLIGLIRLLFKKELRQMFIKLLGVVIGMQAAIVIFYVFWGLNYFREPAGIRLQLTDTSYTLVDLKNATLLMIDSANSCRHQLDTLTDLRRENGPIINTAEENIRQMAVSSQAFRIASPRLKRSLISPLLNYLSTSGYYNPFTSEAQINFMMPVFVKPFVACHELSHQAGFAFEDEANFAGFLACIRSRDKLSRYSAYYVGMEEFMHTLRLRDSVTFKTLKSCISPQVKYDLRQERDYWLKYQGQISWLSSVFYNSYLKANNQPRGLDTYNQMIRLAMALYKKQGGKL